MAHEVECPGCGLKLPGRSLASHEHYNASGECWEMKGDLTVYNMTRGNLTFTQQYCVDAYGAQHTGSRTKAITTVFALVGLYLAIEHNFTGKQVQYAHMHLNKLSTGWPLLNSPQTINEITILNVLNCDSGKSRDDMIKIWAKSVWNSWESHHYKIRTLCDQNIKDELLRSLFIKD